MSAEKNFIALLQKADREIALLKEMLEISGGKEIIKENVELKEENLKLKATIRELMKEIEKLKK